MVAQEFACGLGQVGAGLDFVLAGLRVLDQGGGSADFTGEELSRFEG
jgi:hypothetical protein